MAKDFYEILGVSKGASADELKKAYRRLAMQHHPDKNPGDKKSEEKFKEISHAYDILSDEQKRAAYDQYGHAAFQGGAGGPGGGAGFSGFDFGGSFSDIFEDLFGGMSGRGRQRGPQTERGSDLRYNMQITLEEAFKGKQDTIKVTTSVACDVCAGSGAAKGSSPVTCATCNGQGRVRAQQGFFTVERACATCGGSGKMIKDPCKNCAGSGRVRKEKTLSVTIPKGVEDGTRIRLTGEGEAGPRGGPSGDIYIFLTVKAHSLFERDGADLHCRVPIPMTTAALGGTIEVPTLGGGRVKVTIPEGTQNGHQFRLKGKGMPVLHENYFGDLYLHTVVETPVKLTKKQKELIKEFDSADPKGHSPESESFFKKVKEFFGDLRE